MYKVKFVLTLLCSCAVGLTSLAQRNNLWNEFKNPSTLHKPIPFWHLNGQLTTQEINRQVADAAKSGFGGVAVLPVTAGAQHPTGLPSPGMSPTYLTEEYFSRYQDILKAAKSNGIKVILYDDVDFPSGSAGGALQQKYPEATRKILEKTDTTVTGSRQIVLPLPKGVAMATVAMNVSSKERINLSAMVKEGKLIWKVPEGSWKIMFFTCKLNVDKIVDYMDPDAVHKFVSLTYDQYAGRFSNYFGNVIQQTFYDDVGYVTMERAWTLGFNKKFQEIYGQDPSVFYPALWEDIGPQTEAARVALFNTRAELLAEGFPKIIGEWADKHGLKTSGHPPGNYEIQPVDMNLDIFKFYRYNHIPTMDAIFYQGHGRAGYKLVSSAAVAYDRPEVAAEIYGAFMEDKFDLKMMYRTAMEIFVRGVNTLIPHGMWYDVKSQSVRIPPLISPYSTKIAPGLNDYNDFAARTGTLLRGGRDVSEIGIIYPIAALEGFYHFQAKDNPGWGKFAPPKTDYLSLSDILTNQVHRDFTFIHPELFAGNQYQIKGDKIELNNKTNQQKYSVIILPSGKVVSYHALKKIKEFYDQGGKVLATGTLPSKSAEFGMDWLVVKTLKAVFGSDYEKPADSKIQTNAKGGMALFIPEVNDRNISDALAEMGIAPDVKWDNNLGPSSGNGALSYLHKVKDQRNIYYFANSSDDVINTKVALRGKIIPEIWDPYTGKKMSATGVAHIKYKGLDYTELSLSLPAVKSVFILEKK
ncbi:glycosyl hydrolase [Pedobacter foliorum]|uniref:glycosyl hydrolase n=1 Tax=Pedobacter foliorum TaxID=2739058 RepID=UPI0015633EB0|nr:glycosyl hydrolase [Pedobacter foliorum]NRF41238.1 hypothetical protein [Pedobacter foliorum]